MVKYTIYRLPIHVTFGPFRAGVGEVRWDDEAVGEITRNDVDGTYDFWTYGQPMVRRAQEVMLRTTRAMAKAWLLEARR